MSCSGREAEDEYYKAQAAPSKGTEPLMQGWAFVPDECGGHMLSATGDKWYPEGHEHRCVSALKASLAAAEAEAERFRYASDKQAVAWRERALAAEARAEQMARERDEARALIAQMDADGAAYRVAVDSASHAREEGLAAALRDAHELYIHPNQQCAPYECRYRALLAPASRQAPEKCEHASIGTATAEWSDGTVTEAHVCNRCGEEVTR